MAEVNVLESLINKLQQRGITLVAVSKTHPPERIIELYEKGQRDFGENRVQEMLSKAEMLPDDIRWHLIGHLQTNKVKYITPFVHTIHSIDSLKLLKEVNKQAQKEGRSIQCLLQFHIAEEESKYGFSENEVIDILRQHPPENFSHVDFRGVMGMATFTDNQKQIRSEFRRLKSIFERLKSQFFAEVPSFSEISMGMSGDWELAVEEGSTMVRIGSLLFGPRQT